MSQRRLDVGAVLLPLGGLLVGLSAGGGDGVVSVGGVVRRGGGGGGLRLSSERVSRDIGEVSDQSEV